MRPLAPVPVTDVTRTNNMAGDDLFSAYSTGAAPEQAENHCIARALGLGVTIGNGTPA